MKDQKGVYLSSDVPNRIYKFSEEYNLRQCGKVWEILQSALLLVLLLHIWDRDPLKSDCLSFKMKNKDLNKDIPVENIVSLSILIWSVRCRLTIFWFCCLAAKVSTFLSRWDPEDFGSLLSLT